MKFKNYLESISGVSIYPMVSILLFTIFFAAVIWYVLKMDKNKVNEIKDLPLN